MLLRKTVFNNDKGGDERRNSGCCTANARLWEEAILVFFFTSLKHFDFFNREIECKSV